MLPTSATPYLLRSSDPSTNFFVRPSARTFPFLLDFDLRETFFRRPLSCVLFFGRLQYRPFLDDFKTVWPSGDLYHNLHIFSSSLFLLGPYSPLQILFVMGAYCFLFPCSIFFCVYWFDPWIDYNSFFSVSRKYFLLHVFIWQFFFLIGRQYDLTRLGSISSALPLSVSRGRHGKLVDKFSHE